MPVCVSMMIWSIVSGAAWAWLPAMAARQAMATTVFLEIILQMSLIEPVRE
jgi:type II secretory pathway component PulJ